MLKTNYAPLVIHSPVVTSTSTGRMINSVLSEAFVFILMNAVWLSASLDEKLALITPLVVKIDPESSLPALSSASLQNLLICLPSLNLLMVLTHLIDGIYILMYPALLDWPGTSLRVWVQLIQSPPFFFVYNFIYLWLCWVFIVVQDFP